MTQARVAIVPFRRPERQCRIDWALALAVLGNAVSAHHMARITRSLLLVRPVKRREHAKPLGA
jgi:hypothetical protein